MRALRSLSRSSAPQETGPVRERREVRGTASIRGIERGKTGVVGRGLRRQKRSTYSGDRDSRSRGKKDGGSLFTFAGHYPIPKRGKGGTRRGLSLGLPLNRESTVGPKRRPAMEAERTCFHL